MKKQLANAIRSLEPAEIDDLEWVLHHAHRHAQRKAEEASPNGGAHDRWQRRAALTERLAHALEAN